MLSPDCDASFAAVSLTENQKVSFAPSKRYRRTAALLDPADTRVLGLSFRTLSPSGALLSLVGPGRAAKTLIEVREGSLRYYSESGRGRPGINMTTDVEVADGQWHAMELRVSDGSTLILTLDGSPVGYELELSAAHNFLDSDLSNVIVGKSHEDGQGFRGCLSNFSVFGELQTFSGRDRQALMLAERLDPAVAVGGCDIHILQSSQPRNAVDVGVTVVIIFFVLLILAICVSFVLFKLRKREAKKAAAASKPANASYSNSGLDIREQRGYGVPLNNVQSGVPAPSASGRFPKAKKMRPTDAVDSNPLRDFVRDSPKLYPTPTPVAAAVSQTAEGQQAEHYDIENASSIAPSDIDVVYHYKGYRDGAGGRHRRSGGSKSLGQNRRRGGTPNSRQQQHFNNTPLARLSPSSEMSHNPRILTLGDLSGKTLPPGLLVEQSERSLNSPISHVSSNSRHSHHHRGLTSENVARFNQQRVSESPHLHNGENKSSLAHSLAAPSATAGRATPGKSPATVGGAVTSSSSSSSSSEGGDDSFTCSEYEYDEVQGGTNGGTILDSSVPEGMVFSKLASSPPPPPPPPNMVSGDSSSLSDVGDTTPLAHGKTWESLLSWTPTYTSLAGVFRDIAELPHSMPPPEDICRPSPLGDRSDEQYI